MMRESNLGPIGEGLGFRSFMGNRLFSLRFRASG